MTLTTCRLTARLAALAAGVLAALTAGGCASSFGDMTGATASLPGPKAQIQSSGPAKVALLLPLGGLDQTAVTAKAMRQAAELALLDLNEPSVQLTVKDDRGTAEGARAAAEEAIGEGAEVIAGPLLSKAVSGAAPVARAANVPVLAFSNDRQVAGNGVYLMSFLAEQEVDRVISYARANGKARFAALIPDTPYGSIVEPAFTEAVRRAGGSVVAVERFPEQANAMLEPAETLVRTIRAAEASGAPVDALFLPAGEASLPHLGPILAYAGLDTRRVKVIGTGAWDYTGVQRHPILAGGWYASPDPRGWQDFAQRFAKTFGVPPPRLASLAYDAMTVAITLSRFPPGQRYTAQNLTRDSGFTGADGPIRLLGGGLCERGLAILEVQPYGPAVIDAAPAGNGAGPAPQLPARTAATSAAAVR